MQGPEGNAPQPKIGMPDIIQAPLTYDGRAAKLDERRKEAVGNYLVWSAQTQYPAYDEKLFESVRMLSPKVPRELIIQTEGLYEVEDHLRLFRGAAKAEIGGVQPYEDLYFKRHGWVFTEARHVVRTRNLLLYQGVPQARIDEIDRLRDQYPWNPENHGLDSKEATTAYAGWQEKRTKGNYETVQDEYDVAYRTTKDGLLVPKAHPEQKFGADLALEPVKRDEGGHEDIFTQLTIINLEAFPERMSDTLRNVFGGKGKPRMPVVAYLPESEQLHLKEGYIVDKRFGPRHEIETSVKPYLLKIGAKKLFPEYFGKAA